MLDGAGEEDGRANDETDAIRNPGAFDPLADLLLGLIAIVVPLVGLLLASGAGSGKTGAGTPEPGEMLVIAAAADGLHLPSDGSHVPRDRILDDAALAARLLRSRDGGPPILLRIETDGLESAFLFDAVAARHGPPTIRQQRISPSGARP